MLTPIVPDPYRMPCTPTANRRGVIQQIAPPGTPWRSDWSGYFDPAEYEEQTQRRRQLVQGRNCQNNLERLAREWTRMLGGRDPVDSLIDGWSQLLHLN